MTASEALMLLISDVRDYRYREQKRLSDPTISVSELMRRVGVVEALKNVESVIDMVAAMCEPSQDNEGKLAASSSAGERETARTRISS